MHVDAFSSTRGICAKTNNSKKILYRAEGAIASTKCGQKAVLALLWQIFSGLGFPNQFFCDLWVVGFWRGRPWLAGRRIGEASLDVG